MKQGDWCPFCFNVLRQNNGFWLGDLSLQGKCTLLLFPNEEPNLEQKTKGGTAECAGEAAFLISCDWEACPAQVGSLVRNVESLHDISKTVGLL